MNEAAVSPASNQHSERPSPTTHRCLNQAAGVLRSQIPQLMFQAFSAWSESPEQKFVYVGILIGSYLAVLVFNLPLSLGQNNPPQSVASSLQNHPKGDNMDDSGESLCVGDNTEDGDSLTWGDKTSVPRFHRSLPLGLRFTRSTSSRLDCPHPCSAPPTSLPLTSSRALSRISFRVNGIVLAKFLEHITFGLQGTSNDIIEAWYKV